MFRYFWMEGKDIPAGVGFGHFTAKHILMLLLCAVFITVLTLWFKKQPLRRQNTFLKILACLMLAGNLVRDLFLLIIGRMSLAYLPLHLCSFSIFVYLLHAFLPESYNDTVMTLNPANGRPVSRSARRDRLCPAAAGHGLRAPVSRLEQLSYSEFHEPAQLSLACSFIGLSGSASGFRPDPSDHTPFLVSVRVSSCVRAAGVAV